MSQRRRDSLAPLIGSIEGISQTPAYRGLALAVFENLELAEYGNRIPFLTFEVEADPFAPGIGAVLGDASAGLVQSDDATPLNGYAALGSTMQSALEPLIRPFGLDLADDGFALRSPVESAPLEVADTELGSGAASKAFPRSERTQAAARMLPSTLTLSYYDASRDYQTSQMRGTFGEAPGREENAQLPAVLGAGEAKALVQSQLARAWSRRERLTLRLPPRFLGLRPRSKVRLAASGAVWEVERATIEGLAVIVELCRTSRRADGIAADAGRGATSHDAVAAATALALFEAPDGGIEEAAGPTIYIAASSPGRRWAAVPIEVAAAGSVFGVRSSARRTVLGTAQAALPPASEFPLDTVNSVEVELVDHDQWLESQEDEALVHGANLAILGSELIQFGTVEPIGAGRFRLSRLLRGRRGTEWAMDNHAAGEAFALFDPNALRRIDLPPSMHGMTVEAKARGLADSNSPTISKVVGREELRPPSPFPAS